MSRANRGRRAATILPPHLEEQPWIGLWRSRVVGNEDPSKLGRLRLVIPEVTGEAPFPGWIYPSLAPLGGGITDGNAWGSLFVPPAGAWVYVQFIDGDAGYPVWLPGWFGNEKAPSILQQNYPKRRGLVSPSGHYLYLDDSAGAIGDVQLGHRDGAVVWLKGDGPVEIDAKAGEVLDLQAAQSGGALKGVVREGDGVDCGTLVFTAVANGVLNGTYTPPGGTPTAFVLGDPISLRGVTDESSPHTRTK